MEILIFLLILLIYAPLAFILVIALMRLYIYLRFKNVDRQLQVRGVITDRYIWFNSLKTIKLVRAKIDLFTIFPSAEIQFDEIMIDGNGTNKVRLITLKSKDCKANATGLLWIHGGGMAVKRPESETFTMERYLNCRDTVIISPDYTLSLDAPYPAALNDCYNALLYMKNNAKELGINPNQIFIGGGSAGGGLVAALTLMARDKGEVNIAYQMPYYPMVNYENVPKNKEKTEKMLVWDKKRNKIAWQLYLGDLYESDNIPEYASPLYAKSFENLPPAFTFVGTQDPFLYDTIDYVKKLKKAGVKVNYKIYEGAYHGFESSFPRSRLGKQAWEDILNEYEYAVDNYTKEQPK